MSAAPKKSKPARARVSRRRNDNDIAERLLEGEKVVAEARISDFIYWRCLAVLAFAVLVGVLLAVELGALFLVVALIMAVHATILKSILLMVVTNKRVLVRYGILQVDVVDIHFDKVESMELERMITGYMMGYANVVVMGTGNRYIVIPFVANGPQLRRAYNEMTLNRTAEGPPTPVIIVEDEQAG